MESIRLALLLGIILRPPQMAIMAYLGFEQYKELRNRTAYQRIKSILFTLFITNFVLYSFSFFIDLAGYNNWLTTPPWQQFMAVGYVLANILSSAFITVLLLAIYKIRVSE